MKEVYQAALIGCGDYVRWLIDDLNQSKRFTVSHTYDLVPEKSKKRAGELHAAQAGSPEEIFANPAVDIVLIFTPPWARIELFKKAVKTGKHIITTKPLSPSYKEALELSAIVNKKVECAVLYGRSGDAAAEALKQLFEGGEIGKLALYKEDWFHHYPQWNDWATEPSMNGGPFMDAMIHNLNKASYFVGESPASFTFFSENFAQKLPCNDTEFMKVDYPGGASAHLFITWAADLEVYALTGNEREHIGLLHMITDQGWYVTLEESGGRQVIRAKKEDSIREWEVNDLPRTPFDEFVYRMEQGMEQHITLEMAVHDIEIIEKSTKSLHMPVSLA